MCYERPYGPVPQNGYASPALRIDALSVSTYLIFRSNHARRCRWIIDFESIDYQCVTGDRVAPSRKMGKRLRLYVLTRYQYLLTLFSGRITPGGVGGLQILETLTINELYQCHPPSPIWQDAYEKASQVNFVDRQATLAWLVSSR